MKNGKALVKFTAICLCLTVISAFGALFSAFAEPDETYAIESFSEESSESYGETYSQSDETETAEPTEADTTVQTDALESSTQITEATSAAASSQPAEEPTYRASLPTVENTQVVLPTVVGAVDNPEESSLFWGFVSWILIGVGVAVIFAVVLSTKAKTYRGGRDRYSSTDKISGKKKLLPADYYDKRKLR